MIRKAFVMQVNPDAHEEYQRRHNPIWPELEAVLKSHGANSCLPTLVEIYDRCYAR
ncbi:L-rhamnose mutarotase [Escherichia coli]|nr:L-rhamnose mutarotase [Escherichia coli]